MERHEVWIIERSRLAREGLKAVLDGPDYDVTRAVADTTAMSLQANTDALPSLIVMAGSGSDGDEEVRSICQLYGVPVIVLADALSLEQLKSSFRAGASGYVLRDIPLDSLKQTMALVLAGEKVLPTELVAMLTQGSVLRIPLATPPFSDVEIGVLTGIARGRSNKMIAFELDMDENQVKQRVKGLFHKMGVRNRTEAAIWAVSRGFNAAGEI